MSSYSGEQIHWNVCNTIDKRNIDKSSEKNLRSLERAYSAIWWVEWLLVSNGRWNKWCQCFPPNWTARFAIRAVVAMVRPWEIAKREMYSIVQVFPLPGNPRIPTHFVYDVLNVDYSSMACFTCFIWFATSHCAFIRCIHVVVYVIWLPRYKFT